MLVKISKNSKRIIKIGGLLALCALIIAIPATMLFLPQSVSLAESVYMNISKLLGTDSPSIISINDDGIPVVDYGHKNGIYIGEEISPLAVADAAINYYDEFIESRDEKAKTYFLNCINWLDTSKIDTNSCFLWAYNFPDPGYGITEKYYSSLAQGRIMLAYERAYRLTGEDRYLELAESAMLSLDTPINEGGVLYRDSDSIGNWYCEIVSDEVTKPPFILNGQMDVSLYLYEYYELTGSEYALELFEEGVAQLEVSLGDYDTGSWTYYDLEKNFSYDYHYTHIKQLESLYEITGNETLLEYKNKWSSYFPVNPMWARKRFAAYLLNTVIIFSILAAATYVFVIIKKRAVRKNEGQGQ